MYNKIQIIGNLGADPEVKQTGAGTNYAILSVATNRVVKGEKETEWHKCVVWDDKIADILAKYTKKGSRVLLEGRLTYRKWQTDTGEERVKAEIHLDRFNSEMKLMDSKSDGNVSTITSPTANQTVPSDVEAGPIIEDDVPY
jgi:single-strand DNA-binding protein